MENQSEVICHEKIVEECMLKYKFGIIKFFVGKILKESKRFCGKLCGNDAFHIVEELARVLQ